MYQSAETDIGPCSHGKVCMTVMNSLCWRTARVRFSSAYIVGGRMNTQRCRMRKSHGEIGLNPNSWQEGYALHDLDGYFLIVSEFHTD